MYSSVLYLTSNQEYLLPGTCEEKNINALGFLRCSTFQEGNYYATYLAFVLLIFGNSIFVYIVSIVGIFISSSPISLIAFAYFSVRRFLNAKFANVTICIMLLLLFVFLYFFGVVDGFHYSPTSSLMERAEFIRAAIYMFKDSPLIGVGLGQYSENISRYTEYDHVYRNSLDGSWTYIANSGVADVLSEQGLMGAILLFVYISNYIRSFRSNDQKLDFLFVFLLISIAAPSYFQVYIGLLMGIYFAKCKEKKLYI